MLSDSVFRSEFLEFIAPHFGLNVATDRLQYAYYEAFSGISDRRFTELMDLAFRECERFAPVNDPDRRAFSVPWVLQRSSQLMQLEAQSQPLALPSDLDNMTEAELIENRRKLRRMLIDINGLKSAAPLD